MDDLNRANEILHLIKYIILEKAIFFFSARMSASLLKKIVHSFAMPPVEAKTRGVNEALSTSRIL